MKDIYVTIDNKSFVFVHLSKKREEKRVSQGLKIKRNHETSPQNKSYLVSRKFESS